VQKNGLKNKRVFEINQTPSLYSEIILTKD
jgi:hypothetical protein